MSEPHPSNDRISPGPLREQQTRSAEIDPMDQYLLAVQREHAAWDAIKQHLASRRGPRRKLWAVWVKAVAQVQLEALAYLHASRPLVSASAPSVSTLVRALPKHVETESFDLV